MGSFIVVTTVLPLSGRVGLPTETFSGAAKVLVHLMGVKWQDRGIIPDEKSQGRFVWPKPFFK